MKFFMIFCSKGFRSPLFSNVFAFQNPCLSVQIVSQSLGVKATAGGGVGRFVLNPPLTWVSVHFGRPCGLER